MRRAATALLALLAGTHLLSAQTPNAPPASQATSDKAELTAHAQGCADRVTRDRARLEGAPNNLSIELDLARSLALCRRYAEAIARCRQVLAMSPGNREAGTELARVLGWDREYEGSIRLYQELLKETPRDTDLLESLARVYVEAGRLEEALETYRALLADHPDTGDYGLEVARLELRLKDYRAARDSLASMLSTQPENRGARLLLARLDLTQSRFQNSLQQFDQVLEQYPSDAEALYGKAQVDYYQGRLVEAYGIAARLVKEHPDNFDDIFLLASVERARHHRHGTLALLDRADQLSPAHPEVEQMRDQVERPFTLHTSASFAREIGGAGQGGASSRQDLRAFTYGTTLEVAALPRSDSFLSLDYLPSSSPLGGVRGAAGPGEFTYHQATRVSSFLTVRGGAGLARFGPGPLENVPGQLAPAASATVRPVGFAGMSLSPRKDFELELNWSRSAIDYTPLAARLGVIESRLEGGLNFFLGLRTELHVRYFKANYSSESYDHASVVNRGGTIETVVAKKADRDRAHGGSLVLNRNLVRFERVSFDLGYSGLAYGYEGERRGVYLGFFNPAFYQRHLATTRLHGKLWGPVGYDFSGGVGLQQVRQRQALTRGLVLNPALTWKVSRRLSLRLGFVHYSFAQTLGPLRGNAVQLSNDVRF